METVYSLDAELAEIITTEESETFTSTGQDMAGNAAENTIASSPNDERDKDILSHYLKELRAGTLLKPHEELELSKENVEQEEKAKILTRQLMLLVAQLVNKNKLLSAPVHAHPAVRVCVTAASLQRKIKALERDIQKSAAGSYERRKLNSSKTQIASELRTLFSRADLSGLKNRAILRELPAMRGVGFRKKVSAEKEFLRIVQEIETAEARAQAARDQFVKSNLRLVVGIARRYQHWGMPIADLIQEGNIGLMRAAEKFDYRMGARFSTYASWWIRQAVVRCIDAQRSSIRLPVYINERCKKIKKITRQIVQDTGEEPMPVSLAAAMGISTRHIAQIQQISQDTISLETPAGKEEGSLKHFIVDPAAGSPLDEIMREQRLQTADHALQVLAPREQEIIKLRFGIGEDAEHTLEEIGRRFGLSRERIRQLEDKALSKLKRSEKLRRCFEQFS